MYFFATLAGANDLVKCCLMLFHPYVVSLREHRAGEFGGSHIILSHVDDHRLGMSCFLCATPARKQRGIWYRAQRRWSVFRSYMNFASVCILTLGEAGPVSVFVLDVRRTGNEPGVPFVCYMPSPSISRSLCRFVRFGVKRSGAIHICVPHLSII